MIEHFRQFGDAELDSILAIMPSPDPDQAIVDREENIPAIYAVQAERAAHNRLSLNAKNTRVTVDFTKGEADVLLSALDGFEPDTASYDPEETDPMGWSPEDVVLLNSAYGKIFERVKTNA